MLKRLSSHFKQCTDEITHVRFVNLSRRQAMTWLDQGMLFVFKVR